MVDLQPVSNYNEISNGAVGICIGKVLHSGTHIGLIYPNENSNNHCLHLAFHCLLIDEPIDIIESHYRWVPIIVDEYLLPSVISWCHLVYKKNKANGIPYGLHASESSFDKEGIVKIGKNEHGLSCATFVLKVLEKSGLPLLECSSWPPADDEDKKAQRKLVFLLRSLKEQHNISETHISNVEKEIGCVRIRPEQVTAGAITEERPVNYNDGFPLGKEIFNQLPEPTV